MPVKVQRNKSKTKTNLVSKSKPKKKAVVEVKKEPVETVEKVEQTQEQLDAQETQEKETKKPVKVDYSNYPEPKLSDVYDQLLEEKPFLHTPISKVKNYVMYEMVNKQIHAYEVLLNAYLSDKNKEDFSLDEFLDFIASGSEEREGDEEQSEALRDLLDRAHTNFVRQDMLNWASQKVQSLPNSRREKLNEYLKSSASKFTENNVVDKVALYKSYDSKFFHKYTEPDKNDYHHVKKLLQSYKNRSSPKSNAVLTSFVEWVMYQIVLHSMIECWKNKNRTIKVYHFLNVLNNDFMLSKLFNTLETVEQIPSFLEEVKQSLEDHRKKRMEIAERTKNMSEEEKPKRKLLSRWDWLWLIIAFLILLYVVLERLGMPVVNQTEQEELIENPHRD